jgi:predicted Zn-dependent protease with MMP-like domain
MMRGLRGNADGPDLEQFQKLAEAAFAALPEKFRRLCGNLVVLVAEQASEETLRALNIDNPLALSGLFEGVPHADTGGTNIYALPNHIHLYRRSILAEWRARGDVALPFLITHVLVHEIGHHFGLSDADMHAIEDTAP